MLQELDGDQINEFLRRWHALAYEEGSKGERKRASLVRAIEHSPAIQQLAGNPLLLTLMAILHRTQELPRDRAELYNQCTRLLLHQWKTELAFASSPELAQAQLDGKDKLGLMKRIARTLQAGAEGGSGRLLNLIEEKELERTLTDGLRGMLGMLRLRPERAARALIGQLRGRNFMLCFMGGGHYAFVHRTFLEYFCAEAIVDRFQVEQSLALEALKSEIFGHWADESWQEVLRLIAGQLAPKFVEEILEWLLEQADPSYAHILLAARCVGEVRDRGDLGATDERVRKATKELISLDISFFNEDWLEGLGQVNSVRRLAWEASWPIKAARQQAISIMAEIWKDQKDTLIWLKECARSNKDLAVRLKAAEELTRGWREDPETLDILKELARTAEDEYVRQGAVEHLARGWRENPEVQAFLKAYPPRSQED